MTLSEIRELKLHINDLIDRVNGRTECSAIRYDGVRVQTSPVGDALERSVINYINDVEMLDRAKKQWMQVCKDYDVSGFTPRQEEFIYFYFFNAETQIMTGYLMGIKDPAVSRLKYRVLEKEQLLHGGSVCACGV
jgi:hypothetical protein